MLQNCHKHVQSLGGLYELSDKETAADVINKRNDTASSIEESRPTLTRRDTDSSGFTSSKLYSRLEADCGRRPNMTLFSKHLTNLKNLL